ncbi:hypothetical protein [Nocardiopsis sp. HUAS JQ3]|uniref:zinc finger domain-containing protein n=1 Tax=Nocardiopsis sp. HUAS JQ3 TaxID=3061629 RepID=UPI0023A970B3|nr:hypothetical protein [Nocardiopsis sp. HUAS JQ3]WDZ91190.1 hypothetical protein PV789_01015 [Nocardiopsis sp. HUAS JQ3]
MSVSTSVTGGEPLPRFTAEWFGWVRESTAASFTCPRCKAGAGSPCRTLRRRGGLHRGRYSRWLDRYVDTARTEGTA